MVISRRLFAGLPSPLPAVLTASADGWVVRAV